MSSQETCFYDLKKTRRHNFSDIKLLNCDLINTTQYLCLALVNEPLKSVQKGSFRDSLLPPGEVASQRTEGGGVVRGNWIWVTKIVLFQAVTHCHRAAPVWAQGQKRENIGSFTVKIHACGHNTAAGKQAAYSKLPEFSPSLKHPQHKWILHCFLTFSFIAQWNKNTKSPRTK